jgi:hypothetical protein
MGVIKFIVTSIRRVVRFPLVQLLFVVVIILFLQAADDNSTLGQIFNALDRTVDSTVQLLATAFTIKSFTKSGLTFDLMIAYVYLVCLLIIFLTRVMIAATLTVVARTNAFGLRNTIARERGIAAYRAWLPFERIRPPNISQAQWEETFAWPPNNEPPYPSLRRRMLAGFISNLAALVIVAALLQAFTPIPAVTWLVELVQYVIHRLQHASA